MRTARRFTGSCHEEFAKAAMIWHSVTTSIGHDHAVGFGWPTGGVGLDRALGLGGRLGRALLTPAMNRRMPLSPYRFIASTL
jgi:hypothetical protein